MRCSYIIIKLNIDGLRPYVNYRGLNKSTIKNKYPLPIFDELVNQLSGANFFSKIDLKTGYNEINIKEGDIEKTTFCSCFDYHESLVLPIGLINAPSMFINLMNTIFREYLEVFTLDILVYSKNEEEHNRHLETVFEVLRKHKLYAKRSKYQFCSIPILNNLDMYCLKKVS